MGIIHGERQKTNEIKQHKTNKAMGQGIIRLTESKLNRIIREAVKRILRESDNPKTRVLDDNDWETLVCGDLGDEEALYDVINKCKRHGITLDDIVNDYMCDKFCTERGCDPSDVAEELSE